MAETLRDLVVSLTLNSDNFTRNIASVNRQIREAESSFKMVGAGISNFENTTAGAAARTSTLKSEVGLQRLVVDQYEKALAQAEDKLSRTIADQEKFSAELAKAQEAHNGIAEEIDKHRDALQELEDVGLKGTLAYAQEEAQIQSLEDAYNATGVDVMFLSDQVNMCNRAMQNAADGVSVAETQLNNAEAKLRSMESELRVLESEIVGLGTSMENFGGTLETIGGGMAGLGEFINSNITEPVKSLGKQAIDASLAFESSFARVRMTVSGTEEDYALLSKASKEMSTTMATSTDEINAVMSTAGQLGIATENIEQYATTMINLSKASTDLTADEAATQLAKFMNIMGTSQKDIDKIGSTIIKLGNNFATTEAPIAEMSMRLAGAGKQVGLTEAQVLGFATALSSVGIQAQAGGSAFSKALTKIEVASATGDKSLKQYAEIAGMTTAAFDKLWKSDPAAAFQAFIVGLGKLDEEGESTIAVLEEMGLKEIRLRDTLLRATNANELFGNAQQMAVEAWNENTAMMSKAEKVYATTASKIQNLKNKATVFAQTVGDDMNPVIGKLVDVANNLVDRFMDMDEGTRTTIERFAAIAAVSGPVLLIVGKLTAGIGGLIAKGGKLLVSMGTYIAQAGGVGAAFTKMGKAILSGPGIYLAASAGLVILAKHLNDVATGAAETKKALDGMDKSARDWEKTAAETFYGKSEGLSYFGMSKEDFAKDSQSAQTWMQSILTMWSDGQKETDEQITAQIESFKRLTGSTREELEALKATSDAAGQAQLSGQIQGDIDRLDKMDKEIESLLKKRKNRKLSDKDKLRLQELVDERDELIVKYKLSPDKPESFAEIGQKVQAEVARAQLRGQKDASISVYQNALVAAAEGMAALNTSIDEQYDKELAVLMLIEDEGEREKAIGELNQSYLDKRKAAAVEYAKTMQGVIDPVWNEGSVQEAKTQMGDLFSLLRKYSMASEKDKPAILTEMESLSENMDEGAMAEYVSMLTQIQSLMDNGMSEEEVQEMFPEIDFSAAMEQYGSVSQYLESLKNELPGLYSMFNDSLPEEVLKISTDLDMTGAMERWSQFASNPGAITTNALIEYYMESEFARKQSPTVQATVGKYVEKPEGADKSSLTPEGLLAYVSYYAEQTTGADCSKLTPDDITALVGAYDEIAAGADLSKLTPDQITAKVMEYLEGKGVDTSNLKPDAVTAFVMAYSEIETGANKAGLTPSGIVAKVTAYMEADGVDTSKLSPDTITAMVAAYDELASGTDITKLKPGEITAYINKYVEDATGVDLSKLAPGAVTAFVDAYAEVKEGASKSALSPTDIAAWIGSYLEAEGVDLSKLKPDDIEATVSRYAEALGCDKSALLEAFVAYISEYKQKPTAVVPQIETTVLITGYDLKGLKEFEKKNPDLMLQVPMRLGELPNGEFENLLNAGNVKFYENGIEIPVTAVPKEKLDASTVAVLDEDGTLHVMVTPELSGSPEAIGGLKEEIEDSFDESDYDGYFEQVHALWSGAERLFSVMDTINTMRRRMQTDKEGGFDEWFYGFNAKNNQAYMDEMLSEEDAANISAYVSEIVTAIQTGQEVSEEDLKNFQDILSFYNLLDETGIGGNIKAGIAQGLTDAGWSSDAETVAANVEEALNTAFVIKSPSHRMEPIGDYVAQGLAKGMRDHSYTSDGIVIAAKLVTAIKSAIKPAQFAGMGTSAASQLSQEIGEYDFSGDTNTAASSLKSAASSSFTTSLLKGAGLNAMSGLAAGIRAGTSYVTSAIRTAARHAVDEFKEELVIESPSHVMRDEVGVMMMRGLGVGVTEEARRQAKIIRNAASYLTDEARGGIGGYSYNHGNHYTTNDASVTVRIDSMQVRNDGDIHRIAKEIASLGRRTSFGYGR